MSKTGLYLILALIFSLSLSFSSGCGSDDSTADGDAETDGDVKLDGDVVVDGDNNPDGDTAIDGDDDSNPDGDTVDGDEVIDGDNTPDGDTDSNPDGDDDTEADSPVDGDTDVVIDGDADGDSDDETADGDLESVETESDTEEAPDTSVAIDDFEDGNFDGWTAMDDSFTINVNTTTAANGSSYSLEMNKLSFSTTGLERRFDAITPCEVSYWTYTSTCPADGYQNHFILSEPDDEDAFVGDIAWIHIEMNMGSDSGLIYSRGAEKTKLADCLDDHWFHVVLKPDWNAKTIAVSVDDVDKGSFDFKDTSASSLTRVELFGATSERTARWDEIKYKTTCD